MPTNALRTRTLATALTLGLALGPVGCDRELAGEAQTLRTGSGIGGTTFNTSNWVSAGARDVYEFHRLGDWHPNTFNFETKLKEITFTVPGYGEITTDPSAATSVFTPRVKLTADHNLKVTFYPPFGGPSVVYEGPDLVGLELRFKVKYAGGTAYYAKLRVTGHFADPSGGDLFEFVKLDPTNDATLGPICEVSTLGDRFARVYGDVSIDGDSGTVNEPDNIVHIACTSGAPGKSSLYGYLPHGGPELFSLVNRVIRADYCHDGYPYTFPGNSLMIRDNVSPGQEGQTMAQIQQYAVDNNAALEAIWDPNGILCIDTPRVDTLERGDIICPVKVLPDGVTAYNWQPPPCDQFVDADPNSLRVYSLTAL